MTYKTYSEIVRSAYDAPSELFINRWLLMPETSDIPGTDPADLDKTKQVLLRLHSLINRPVAEIRSVAGLSQSELAARIAAPVSTVQGWEQRRACPAHVKLMMLELLGQWSPAGDMGVQADG